MTAHNYVEADTYATQVARMVRPACTCGWQADQHYIAGGPAWGIWNGHAWRVVLEPCLICNDRPATPHDVLCRTNHCSSNECVRRCRWCMDELRDERD